jgi:hypothetical protein
LGTGGVGIPMPGGPGQRRDREDMCRPVPVLLDRLDRADGLVVPDKAGQDPRVTEQRPGVHGPSPKVDGLQMLAPTVAHGSGVHRAGCQL